MAARTGKGMKQSDPMGDRNGLSVKFWGVRGSVPVCGPQFIEFGGNTPCVEVRCGDRLFIIDAGTGIAALGSDLGTDAPHEVDIVLSHLHLDHVGGLPFFKPALMGDRLVRIYCGIFDGGTAEEALDRLFAPPLFPVSLDELPSKFEHYGFRSGDTVRFVGGGEARTIPLRHPGGATGYRFEHGGRSVCYISDIEHGELWPPPDLVRFIAGSDLVIFDGMFSETEYLYCRGWGHSTWQKGIALCQAAGVERLAVFHLHPKHDDAYLRNSESEIKAAMPGAFVAREGTRLTFPARMPATAAA